MSVITKDQILRTFPLAIVHIPLFLDCPQFQYSK